VDEDRQSVAGRAGDSLKEEPGAASGREAPHDCHERLPGGLRRRLDASADAWICSAATRDESVAVPPIRAVHVVDRKAQRRGWYAAAACLLLAIVGWWPRLGSIEHDANHDLSPSQAEAERGREDLLNSGSQHLGRWAWSHESGVEADVQGDVVWDGERQVGYLRLSGLAPNGETGRQYQLWIFDAARDDRFPVDGGVFDVPLDSPMITVPIRPTLMISQPVAFAVTFERAGGVVVSDRRHLMALARAGGS